MLLEGQGRGRDRAKQRIIELRKNFIAEGLDLEDQQSKRFWPIYDRFQEQSDSLKVVQRFQSVNSSNLNDQEADKILTTYIKCKESEMQLHIQYYKEISLILPAKKILLINERERLFNKKAFDRVRKRRSKRGEN